MHAQRWAGKPATKDLVTDATLAGVRVFLKNDANYEGAIGDRLALEHRGFKNVFADTSNCV